MNLIFTEPFHASVAEIKEYISRDSTYYATLYIRKMITHIEILKRNSYLGRVIPEQDDINYRELIYGKYRVLYKVSKDKVYLIRVIHGKRKFSKRFLKF